MIFWFEYVIILKFVRNRTYGVRCTEQSTGTGGILANVLMTSKRTECVVCSCCMSSTYECMLPSLNIHKYHNDIKYWLMMLLYSTRSLMSNIQCTYCVRPCSNTLSFSRTSYNGYLSKKTWWSFELEHVLSKKISAEFLCL